MGELVRLSGSTEVSGPLAALVIALWVIGVVIHVAFALGVMAHARDRTTVFVGPTLWWLATLLGGPLVALAYWLMHASSLAVRRDE